MNFEVRTSSLRPSSMVPLYGASPAASGDPLPLDPTLESAFLPAAKSKRDSETHNPNKIDAYSAFLRSIFA